MLFFVDLNFTFCGLERSIFPSVRRFSEIEGRPSILENHLTGDWWLKILIIIIGSRSSYFSAWQRGDNWKSFIKDERQIQAQTKRQGQRQYKYKYTEIQKYKIHNHDNIQHLTGQWWFWRFSTKLFPNFSPLPDLEKRSLKKGKSSEFNSRDDGIIILRCLELLSGAKLHPKLAKTAKIGQNLPTWPKVDTYRVSQKNAL